MLSSPGPYGRNYFRVVLAKLGETIFGFFAGLAVARSKSIHYEIIVIKHLQKT